MRPKKFTQPHARQAALATTLDRLVGQSPFNWLREMRRFAGRKVAQTPDPISLAILAIDRVGPAAVRACASGVKSASQRLTRPPQPCCAPRWPRPPDGAAPID